MDKNLQIGGVGCLLGIIGIIGYFIDLDSCTPFIFHLSNGSLSLVFSISLILASAIYIHSKTRETRPIRFLYAIILVISVTECLASLFLDYDSEKYIINKIILIMISYTSLYSINNQKILDANYTGNINLLDYISVFIDLMLLYIIIIPSFPVNRIVMYVFITLIYFTWNYTVGITPAKYLTEIQLIYSPEKELVKEYSTGTIKRKHIKYILMYLLFCGILIFTIDMVEKI